VTGWLVYNSSTDLPTPLPVDSFDSFLDDFTLVPYDKEPLYDHVDQSIQLDFEFDNLDDGAN
jgi:iron transport multicopper oxidase